jgi:hypothetical protein
LVDAMLGRLSRGLTAGAVLWAGLLVASGLRAQEMGPILLSYRAPPGCPEVAEFQRSVLQRSPLIHFVDEGSHDRELSIVLNSDGIFTRGELRLVEPDGRLRQRSVRFTTCAEAIEGLALITVVSLDPHALLEPAAPQKPNPAPPATPKSPALAPIALPPSPAAVRRAPRLEIGLGAEVNLASSALPASALGGTLFLDAASGSRSWLAPLVRLALGHAQRRGLADGRADSNFEANFALTLVTLVGCPVQIASRLLAVRPCLFASGGALRAWGSNSPVQEARTRPYWAWGGTALLALRLSQSIEIIGDTLLGVSLIRDQFGFDQPQFWKTPVLYLSSGVGLRFVYP